MTSRATDTASPLYDPFDAGFQRDPYPTYQTLRDQYPVYQHPQGYVVLSRFNDIWDAVHQADIFSSASGLTFHNDEIGQLGLAPTIVMLDPPRHTQLRRLVSKGFTPRRVQLLEDDIRHFVRQRLQAMAEQAHDGATIDLHRDYSSPLPTYVLATLLGVPREDRARFDPWVAALVSIQNDGMALDGLADAQAAVVDMFAYFSDVITQRRSAPGDDLISALALAEIDGQRLSDWDILGFCFVMVAGGNDTTGNLISHGVMLLDQFPQQRQRLLADPALLPGACLEFLRLEGSVQGLARTTQEATVVAGTEIPAGCKVMLLYASANRDQREFGPSADQMDVTRAIPRHLGFASGPHFCIGSHLARLQAKVAFEELLARFPSVGVDVEAGQRLPSAFTRGWVSLPATGLLD